MEQEKILYYLETLHKSTGVPLVYGTSGPIVRSFQPFSVTASENELSFIAQRLQGVIQQLPGKHVMYLQHPSMVMLGLVVNPIRNEFVFVGPLASSLSREEDIADYLFFAGLSAETTRQLSSYMNSTSTWAPTSVRQLLLNINMALNDECLSEEALGEIEDRETEERAAFNRKHFHTEEDRPVNSEPMALSNYSEKLVYCISHGDLTGFAELLTQIDTVPFPQGQISGMKEQRRIAYGSIFAAENAAFLSGISADMLERTREYYLDRIDRAADPNELQRLLASAMFDFTKHVREFLKEKTDNPAIGRAVEYIRANLNTKLVAEDIAAAIHVTPHYLFTNFKQETGKTLTEFINEEKIKKACYYIVFTDKSFAEIANFLSFSSQSYFQSVFKKVMGKTPNEWKKENRK